MGNANQKIRENQSNMTMMQESKSLPQLIWKSHKRLNLGIKWSISGYLSLKIDCAVVNVQES